MQNARIQNAELKTPNFGYFSEVLTGGLFSPTCTSFTIISRKILIDLNYNLTKTVKKQRIITGKGTTSPLPIISISWFNCAGKIINNFEILGYDIPKSLKVDGILGMNFLVKHGAIIALNNKKIYFDHQ